MISLYIHLPFCHGKCRYCDFVSTTNMGLIDDYLQALFKEMDLNQEKFSKEKIRTIYLGGGTPSSLGQKRLEKLFEKIRDTFQVEDGIEWTMEVNPESGKNLDFEALAYRGLNRVSMGIQSGQDQTLKFLGRIHCQEDVLTCLNQLEKAGIQEINGDFIFGLPNQDLQDIEKDLNYLKNLHLSHLSYYSFIPEEGTPLGDGVLEGRYLLPEEELDRAMAHKIEDALKDLGYKQYEVSNFTKKNPCRHNLAYWEVKDYLGVGLNAHSSYGNKRWENVSSFQEYFDRIKDRKRPILQSTSLTNQDRLLEKIILSLRLNRGISVKELEKDYKIDFSTTFKEALDKNLGRSLVQEENNYRLTSYGRDIANRVELDFYTCL